MMDLVRWLPLVAVCAFVSCSSQSTDGEEPGEAIIDGSGGENPAGKVPVSEKGDETPVKVPVSPGELLSLLPPDHEIEAYCDGYHNAPQSSRRRMRTAYMDAALDYFAAWINAHPDVDKNAVVAIPPMRGADDSENNEWSERLRTRLTFRTVAPDVLEENLRQLTNTYGSCDLFNLESCPKIGNFVSASTLVLGKVVASKSHLILNIVNIEEGVTIGRGLEICWIDPDAAPVREPDEKTESVGDAPPSFPGFIKTRKNRQGYHEYRHKKSQIVFVYLPGGKFEMGSPEGEPGRQEDETLHEVQLSPFLISKYELRDHEWYGVLSPKLGMFTIGDFPSETLTWGDGKRFCKQAGLDLPTEAQWEYACRGGAKTAFAFGATLTRKQANFKPAGFEYPPDLMTTKPTLFFEPNGYGLYQMHGNVREWCEDRYAADFYKNVELAGVNPLCNYGPTIHVLRGGGKFSSMSKCRSASRQFRDETQEGENTGLRPVYNPE